MCSKRRLTPGAKAGCQYARAATICVNPGGTSGCQTTIAAAVSKAAAGDTIQVAAGTYVWSPDGRTVAFVVHTASLAAVCTLSVAGDFRYLGDLGHDGLLGPPVAPVGC